MSNNCRPLDCSAGVLPFSATLQGLPIIYMMTLLLLLFHSHIYWYIRVPVTCIAVLGILFPRICSSPLFWLLIASFISSGNFYNWSLVDNHKFLLGYWCFAIFLASLYDDQQTSSVLRSAACNLLAFCMLFSAVAKLSSESYRDCSFFHFTLLSDVRFASFTAAMSGMDVDSLAANRTIILNKQREYINGNANGSTSLKSSSDVLALAFILTWWTVGIELVLGVLFLIPSVGTIECLRSIVLLVFALTTYSVAPVQGFGWLLIIMGLCHLSPSREWLKAAFVFSFVALEVYFAPLWELIERIL